jgi:Ca-activated chloride channel family protein
MIWDREIAFCLFAIVAAGVGLAVSSKRRRQTTLERFAEPRLLERLMPAAGAQLRNASLLFRLGVLAALVVALAGPRWGFKWQEVRREGIDLIVAVDTSRSMLAADVAPNRLERAKLAVLDLLPRLRGDRVGLVPFAGAAFLECPLTLDYTAFSRSLRGLSANTIPLGGTDLAQAIEIALNAFESGESRYQALVLITDGEDHAERVLEAAEAAAERGIKIYTVGIGTADGELIPLGGDGGRGFLKDREGRVIKSRLDEETLGLIAATTDGAYVKGVGPSLGLDRVFDEHIATMERREISSKLERRHEHRFQIPLAIALFLLFVEIALARGRHAATAVGLIAFWSALAPAAYAADPMEAAREGFAAYQAEQYDEAINSYREALLDEPDSPMLRFNLADALYRKERFEEAAAEFAKVAQSEGESWHARAAYNLGNALFRVGEAAEAGDPAAAAERYAESLAAFRRAMSADSADPDPKHGHEFVAKRLERLQQQQEEQQQDQTQEGGEENQDSPSVERQDGERSEDDEDSEASEEGENGEQAQGSEPSSEGPQDRDSSTKEEAQDADEQQQPSANQGDSPEPQDAATDPAQPAGGQPQEPSDDEKMAAQAVLDAAKSEELTPEEVDRGIPIRGGRPLKDW